MTTPEGISTRSGAFLLHMDTIALVSARYQLSQIFKNSSSSYLQSEKDKAIADVRAARVRLNLPVYQGTGFLEDGAFVLWGLPESEFFGIDIFTMMYRKYAEWKKTESTVSPIMNNMFATSSLPEKVKSQVKLEDRDVSEFPKSKINDTDQKITSLVSSIFNSSKG